MARKYIKSGKYQKRDEDGKLLNPGYWETPGYGDYLREYNRLNKIVDKKVKGFTYIEKNYKRGFGYKTGVKEIDISSKVYSKAEFNRVVRKYGTERTPEMIAAGQFNLISEELATIVQTELTSAGIFKDNEKGIPYTIDEIRARQLPQEVWDQMKEVAKGNQMTVSQNFFGS